MCRSISAQNSSVCQCFRVAHHVWKPGYATVSAIVRSYPRHNRLSRVPIQEVKIEAVGKPQETPQMRAKPQLRLGVQVVEGSQSTKPENGHFRILHKRSIQITPVRG